MGVKMDKQDKIEKEIDKTLAMFEKKESLTPNPYFYTRVKQRLDDRKKKRFTISDILKPAFFTLLIILNLTTAIWYTSSDSSIIISDSDLELVDILKSDFNLENDQTENLLFE